MLYPEINKLRDAAGSRYFLVTMASKRARDIIDGYPKLDPTITTNKPVSIAAEEIAEGLFTYELIQDADEFLEAEENENGEEANENEMASDDGFGYEAESAEVEHDADEVQDSYQ